MQINGFSNPFGNLSANASERANVPTMQSAQVVNVSSPVSMQGDSGRRIPSVSASDGADLSTNLSNDRQQLEAEQRIIRELSARDQEVRQHEMAHQMAGGQYTGGATYTFERGPDGVMYAVGGQVSIDTSPVAGDPEATLQKAQTIERAALAPADPSPQDLSVAASARAMANEARVELMREQQESLRVDDENASDVTNSPSVGRLIDEGVPFGQPNSSERVVEAREIEQLRSERAAIDRRADLDQAEETRKSRREEFAQEQQERRERSAEAMREFASDLAEIQARFQELNKRLVETGALQGRAALGSLFDSEA